MKKVKNVISTLVVVFLLVMNADAQIPNWQWAKASLGNEGFGTRTATDNNGNVYVSGYYYNPITFGNITLLDTNGGEDNIYIVKYDPNGNVIWARQAGGPASAYVQCNGIAVDNNNNVYITGSFYNPYISFDTLTLYGPPLIYGNEVDFFVAKYDSAGHILWAKACQADHQIIGNSITADVIGNVYITGYYISNAIGFDSVTLYSASPASGDIFIVKYDANGNVLWSETFGGSSADDGVGITTDANGYFYITGNFISPSITFGSFTLTNTSNSADIFTAKFSQNGNVIWAKGSGGSPGPSYCTSISTDGHGNSFVTGYFYADSLSFDNITLSNSSYGHTDYFIVKYDSSGNAIWAKNAINSDNDQSNSIVADTLGNSYMTGMYIDNHLTFGSCEIFNNGSGNLYITKLDSSGNYVWAKSVGGKLSETGNGITIDKLGNLFITGTYYSPVIAFDTITLSDTATNFNNVIVAKIPASTICSNPTMPASIIGNNIVCVGTTQTFSVAPVSGATYYEWHLPIGWSGSSTSSSITALIGTTSGYIAVSAHNSCGGSINQTDSITVSSSQPIITYSNSITMCVGEINILNAGSGFSIYNWNTGATTQTISVTTAGTYSVTVTNANGCTGTVVSSAIVVNQCNNLWESKPNLSGLSRRNAVGFSIENLGYIGLGYNDSTSSLLSDFWSFNPNTNAWTQEANYGGTARYGSSSFVIGNYAFVGLGIDNYTTNNYRNDFWKYNADSNSWIQVSNFTGTARSFASAFAIGLNGYVGTGSNSTTYYQDFYQYNSTTDTWTQKANYSGGIRKSAVGYAIGTYGYIGSGENSTSILSTFYRYDTTANTWAIIASTPEQFYSGTCFVIGGKAYVGTGSINMTTFVAIPTWWVYDPVANTWTQRTNLNPARLDAVGFSIGNDGYAGTGSTFNSIHNYKDFWRYSPSCTITPTITANGPTTICHGDSVILDAGAYVTFHWSNGKTTETISITLAGTYTVTATDINGCTGTASQVVSVNNVPGQPGVISGNDSVCAGSLQTYSIIAVQGAINYTWTLPNGWTGSSITDSISVIPSSSGIINVTANNSCGSSIAQTLQVTTIIFSTPHITTPNDTSVCGVDTVHLSVNDSLYTSFHWSNNDTTYLVDAIITQTTTYTVTVTNGSGCTGTNSITITINHVPSQPGPIMGNDTVCAQSTQTYRVPPDSGALSYTWNLPTGWSYVSNTGGDSVTYHISSASGTISVIAHDSCGNSVAETLHIVTRQAPTVTISGPSSICDSATLNASTSAHYLWSTQATTQSIHVFTSGTYTVTVTTSEGCTNSATHSIIINHVPNQPGPINGDTSVCAGSSMIPYSVPPDTGATSYTWTLPSGWIIDTSYQFGSYIFVTAGSQGGIISVVGHDSCGNSIPRTLNVTVGSLNLIIDTIGSSTFCPGDSVTFSVFTFNNNNNNTYLWSNGSTLSGITATTSGTYTVTVTQDTTGCTGTATVVATANQNITDSITIYPNTAQLCQGDTVYLLAGQGFTSYQWSTGGTTEYIRIYNSGTYQVTVTNSSGCSGIATRTITFNPVPHDSISTTGPVSFCQGGFVGLNAGQGFASYHWSNNATTDTIIVNSTGTYTVTVSNNYGCTGTASVAVTVNSSPIITTTHTNVNCFGSGDGSISVIATGGSTPYSYSKDGGNSYQSTNIFSNLTAGTYQIMVRDNFGCTSSIVLVVISQPDILVATASGTNLVCSGDSSGTVSTSVTGGTSPYSYSWNNGSTNANQTDLTAGVYMVTVSDMNGCTAISYVTLTQPSNLIDSISANGPTSFCDGGSVMLNAGQGFTSYNWSSGQSTQSITVTSGGNYSVTVANNSGCTAVASRQVTVYDNPNPGITPSGPTTFCSGGSVTLVCDSFPHYSWNTGSTMEAITVNASGNYMVTVTASNGCTGVASQSVTVNQNAIDSITANGPTSFCHGDSVTLNAGSFSSYHWNTGSSSEFILVNTSGTYSVTVSNNAGCTGTASIVINASQPVNPTITANGPTAFCQGGSVTLDAGSWASYHWSNGSTAESIDVTATGTFRVTVTNANGCTGTATQSVNVYFNPAVTITASGSTSICQGNSVTLDAGLFADYLWNTGATAETISASTAGTYAVTVTNNFGCTASASQAVSVISNPSPNIIPNGPTSFCQGGSVMLDAGIFFTYQWSTNSTTETISATTSGTYTVTVSLVNGCTGTASIGVTVNAAPTPTITANGSTTFCSGGSVMLDAGAWTSYHWSTGASSETISASTSGNYMVTITDANGCTGMASQTVTAYANPTPSITGNTSICNGNSTTLSTGIYISYNWSTSATTEAISVSTPGSYSVTVTDNNGCTGMASQIVTVNNNPVPNITHNGPTTFCQGGSVTLMAGSYSTYLWSNGATTGSISASAGGTYMVTVTDNNGCTGTASIGVTVNLSPTETISTNSNTTFCAGDSVTLNAGTWVAYAWNTGSTTQSITVYGSQPYCVTVTDNHGCTGTACQFVDVFALPTPTITPSGPTTFCSGSSVTLHVGTYAAYLWSNGATTSTIAATTTGIYSVTIANINNCTASASISITVNPSPVPVISPSGPTTLCQGGSVTLNAGTYVSYHWMNSQTTQSILVLSSGNYVVTVTGNNGCTGSTSQAVTITPFSNPVITASGPVVFCAPGSVTLDAGIYNTYNWSNGATTETITTSASGLYVVTVSNGANCSATALKSVTANAGAMPTILVTNLNNLCGGGYAHLTVGSSFASYLWSDATTIQMDSVNAGGTYTVTVTNTNGCTGSASTTVASACAIPVIAATPTTNIGVNYAMANWIQPSCHVSYNVRVSVHNANVWTVHTIAPNTHYTISGLTANTTYDWQVQTNCNASLTSVSGYSASQTFTTLLREEGNDGPISTASFNVYPNPASDEATIVFSSDKEAAYTIRLMDILGKEVMTITNTSVVGENQYQMNLSTIAKGIYMVILQNENGTLQKKIVVN